MMSVQGTQDPNSPEGSCTITGYLYDDASDPKTPRVCQDYRNEDPCLPENLGLSEPRERYVSNLFKSSADYHHTHTCYTVSSQDDLCNKNDDSNQLTVPYIKPVAPQLEDGGQATVDDLIEVNLGTQENPHPTFKSSHLDS